MPTNQNKSNNSNANTPNGKKILQHTKELALQLRKKKKKKKKKNLTGVHSPNTKKTKQEPGNQIPATQMIGNQLTPGSVILGNRILENQVPENKKIGDNQNQIKVENFEENLEENNKKCKICLTVKSLTEFQKSGKRNNRQRY